jgi:hypothetical protein
MFHNVYDVNETMQLTVVTVRCYWQSYLFLEFVVHKPCRAGTTGQRDNEQENQGDDVKRGESNTSASARRIPGARAFLCTVCAFSRFGSRHRTPNYVMLTSVYVPYTCRRASQISPTVA